MIRKLNNKGLTLVELLVTMVILAIISSVTIVAVINYYQNSEEKAQKVFMKQIENYVNDYVSLMGSKLQYIDYNNFNGTAIQKCYENFESKDVCEDVMLKKTIDVGIEEISNSVVNSELVNPSTEISCTNDNTKLTIYRDNDFVHCFTFESTNSNNSCIGETINTCKNIFKNFVYEEQQDDTEPGDNNYTCTEDNPALCTIENLGLTLAGGTPNFIKTSCSSGCGEATVGIYKSFDDLGTSYYFRGDVTNNYVKFADHFWRIVRINGDGSIRMIYDGTQPYANGTANNSRALSGLPYSFNPTISEYQSSDIKYLLELWYEANIVVKGYDKYVADAIYCNDINQGNELIGISMSSATYDRINSGAPTLKCLSEKYTKGLSLGNGNLTYPIGLLTGDEANMAGGTYSSGNSKYYLYIGNNFWTMSMGSRVPTSEALVTMIGVSANGAGSMFFVTSLEDPVVGIRPVISLKSDAIVEGRGTRSNPFIVK